MSSSVPEGWQYLPMSQVAVQKKGSIVDGPFGSNLKTSDYVSSGIPVLQGKNITNNKFKWFDVRYINKKKANEIIRSSVRVGDILLVKIGSVGYAAIVDNLNDYPYAIIPANLMKISVDEENYATQYVFQYLSSPEGKQRLIDLASSTAQPALSLSIIKNYKLPIPPLPEQKKIAAILTSVDTVIEKTQAQIDKLKDLKTGMMQELLTKGIGHTEFKDSPVGRIPVEWEVVTLADLISSMDGGVSVNSENKQKASGEMGILKTSCVSKGNFYPNENKVVLHNEMDRLKTPVKDDHIIFSRMNTPALVGESGYVNKSYDDLFLPDRLWLIDVYRDKVYVLWLSYILAFNSTRKKITDAATGTSGSMKNISKPSLLSIKIAYPHINEQEKIASILKSVDKKLNKTLHKLSSYQNIKKVLMQDLLTGKVRVKL